MKTRPRNPAVLVPASEVVDLPVLSYGLTYGLHVAAIISSSNNYGLSQFPEKFLPARDHECT